MVKAMDWDSGRITLSVKDLSPDPWADSGRFRPGDRFDGRVVNMIKSGAFVEIEPGVEGFIHLSRMNLVKKISKPEDLLKIGDGVSVKVISVNPGEKKLSLDLTDDGTGPWNRDAGDLEEIVEGSIERVIPQGVNVRLENGLLGFIPKKELACPPGTDLNKKYAIGAAIRAAVTEFDRDSRNMILSEKKAIENSEKKEYTFYQEKHAATEKSTLGNLLKNKFEELQKNVKKDQ